MGVDKVEFNKSIQVFSLFSKLYSLTRGLYSWDNRVKEYVPVNKFSEAFKVVIKVIEDIKRHRGCEFLLDQIKALEVPKRRK